MQNTPRNAAFPKHLKISSRDILRTIFEAASPLPPFPTAVPPPPPPPLPPPPPPPHRIMSGIAHLPGPANAVPSQVQHYAQPPTGALHIAVPMLPPTSPIWDSATPAALPIASPHPFYLTNPSSVVPSQPREQQPTGAPTPRPRKPYTTTKVREMWTAAEHERMLEGLRLHKRDWAKVTSYVGTRSAAQVRSHAQKYFDRVARDKTDEYVPRARPKRKSSTPYPRKVREEASKTRLAQQAQQAYRPPVPANYPVPVVHPAPTAFEVQPVAFASPQLHHPVRIAPGQSPILSHMPASPYLGQPQQHPVNAHVAVPHRVYAPFMEMSSSPNSNPPRGNVHTAEIQASPLSYVSGQAYPPHSPSIPQQAISLPGTPMYGMLSPITPGAFSLSSGRAPSMTHTPVAVYGQPGLPTPEMPVATPRHSHPEGPVDNCAKCAALQRYGAVLQEIGELNYMHDQSGPQPHHDERAASHSSPVLNNAAHAADLGTAASAHGRKAHIVDGTDNREAPSSSGSVSSRKRKLDATSPVCSTERNERYMHTAPAGNRAHRAKIMRARKLKQRSAATKDRVRNSRSPYEDGSESANSTIENQRRLLQAKDFAVPPHKPSSYNAGAVSKKRKTSSIVDRETGKGEVRRKQRNSLPVERRKLHPVRQVSHVNGKRQLPKSYHQNGLVERRRAFQENATNNEHSPSPKSDESETGPHSPRVESYSPKERMELFDAVHSLQILAKTSSSGSPSSRSRGDPRRSEEE